MGRPSYEQLAALVVEQAGVIEEFLGHADSTTTQIYAHYAPSAHDVEMVNAAFAEEPADGTATLDAAERSIDQ